MYLDNLFFFNRRKLKLSSLLAPLLMVEKNDDAMISRDENQNKIYFYGPLTDESCFKLSLLLEDMIEKSDKIDLYLQTNGGSVLPTLPIIDLIKSSSVPINTYIRGYCASAGTLLSVVGNKRYMTNSSLLLIHSLRQEGIGGNFNNIKDLYDNSNLIMDIIRNIYLENTQIPEDILNYYLDHDLWLPASKCLEYNIIDEIN